MAEVFSGKAYLLVTGASRGIGKSIAEKFASNLKKNSRVLLMARSLEKLKETANSFPKGLMTSYKSVDFSQTTTDVLREAIQESLEGEKAESFDRAIIIHCAAMADYSKLTKNMTSFDEWHKWFNLNTFSPAVLNGVFVSIFPNAKKYVVNVSSYWALEPDVYVGSYCAAKAAKDMFFKVFALENPDVSVLNYLPGFVETDMFFDALKQNNNEALKDRVKSAIENKKSTTPARTAECLVEVFKAQKYKSGDHVDFMKLNV